jgi:rare lipoprotein A
VRVRNLRNNRRVDVTITDRFPKETLNRGRIVDVSYGAAKKLGMVKARVVPVELTVWPK